MWARATPDTSNHWGSHALTRGAPKPSPPPPQRLLRRSRLSCRVPAFPEHADAGVPGQQHRAGEDHSLTQGTSAWEGLGTGKTFLLEGLCQQAVEARLEARLKVAWFTLEDLGVMLRRHRADDTMTKAIARVPRADLIVVDDVGLLGVAAYRAWRGVQPSEIVAIS